MSKRRIAAVLTLIALAALPLTVQADAIAREDLEDHGSIELGPALALERPDLFSRVDSAALISGLPVLTLLDGRRFPLSDLARMGMSPVDVFPVAFLRAVDVHPIGSHPRYGSDGAGGVLNLRLNRMYTGGEVGFFYGRSDGKYGREDYSAHIIGGIGNDRFNITVGAAYYESSGRFDSRR